MKIEEEKNLEDLMEDIENLMTDIFLSGFHAVQSSSLEKIAEKSETARKLGMKRLSGLLESLGLELNRKKSSFESDIIKITENFCRIEFYIEHFRKMQD